ncbi:hypothetical protein CCR75_001289 [Bremia lactucae]|uniref:Secreted RxLR effector n=1 Tax=Bremia lactucae TaxID=4779 RepID=A0A976IEX3_BRELC|nr:hypothetical protein CCR75_001289 [Bremia lactucae]
MGPIHVELLFLVAICLVAEGAPLETAPDVLLLASPSGSRVVSRRLRASALSNHFVVDLPPSFFDGLPEDIAKAIKLHLDKIEELPQTKRLPLLSWRKNKIALEVEGTVPHQSTVSWTTSASPEDLFLKDANLKLLEGLMSHLKQVDESSANLAMATFLEAKYGLSHLAGRLAYVLPKAIGKHHVLFQAVENGLVSLLKSKHLPLSDVIDRVTSRAKQPIGQPFSLSAYPMRLLDKYEDDAFELMKALIDKFGYQVLLLYTRNSNLLPKKVAREIESIIKLDNTALVEKFKLKPLNDDLFTRSEMRVFLFIVKHRGTDREKETKSSAIISALIQNNLHDTSPSAALRKLYEIAKGTEQKKGSTPLDENVKHLMSEVINLWKKMNS